MKFEYIEKEKKIIDKLTLIFEEAIPLAEEEVNKLESLLPDSYNFPAAYKEFLLYGGKNLAGLFNEYEAGYQSIEKRLSTKNRNIANIVKANDNSKKELPEDLFVIEEVNHCSNFTYFLLQEGDNPPVYFWEEDEGGLEISEKLANSFSDYIEEKIRIKTNFWLRNFMSKRLDERKPPRGQQFWFPSKIEKIKGITDTELKKLFRIFRPKIQEQIKTIIGLDSCSYLEELSGWKARKIGDEIRFFPPSNS